MSSQDIYANLYKAFRANLQTDHVGFLTKVPAAGTGWHTATTEWTPKGLTYYLDGRKLGTTTSGVPSTRMHWVLQVETQIGTPPPPDKSAGHIQVDWVSMYTYVP